MKKMYSNNGRFVSPAPKKKNRRKFLLTLAACALALVLLCIGGAALFLGHNEGAEADFQDLSRQVQAAATEATAAPTETAVTEATIPETTAPPETQPPVLPQYAEAYARNSEMIGWLRIDGTQLDYPVMHTPNDPEKYLHLDFDQKNSYPGTPFLDAGCTIDSTNLLIYGHNMPNGTMFRSLMKYEQSTYWKDHPVIVFDTLYQQQEFEVLAAFYDRVYYKTEDVFKFYQFIDPETEEEFNNGIAQFKEKALYDTGITAEFGDQLITLVTCAYHTDNGRFVVVARRK
ncbi:MAG: class B sortase [Oscillospiraceae bacterium]|nr:class B sortase [Oscillospiraceae bacterium]